MSATGTGPDLAGAASGRKLIAIVYADMVGYSRLISLDDAGTLRRLRTMRRALIDPAIREHGGRVVQTGGDSLLVAFDSIDGAVRCAVKVQQQVPVYDGDQPADHRIRFRVGINIGDVIAHGTDLHGDGVNIAARLEAECPVGGICVSRSIRDHVHGRLDLTFEPNGSLALKNIARPVEAFVVRLDPAAEALAHNVAKSMQPSLRIRSRAALLAGAAGLLLIGATGIGWWLYRSSITQEATQPTVVADIRPASLPAAASAVIPPETRVSKAPRLSMVVLPFENLSGDPKDNYLADGITDDLTTDLSHIFNALVIAREPASAFKGNPANARKIGETLGVRYVINGSVRKIETTLRVNVQLTSTETGTQLWSDRFDEPITELAAAQEQIAARMSDRLDSSMIEIENARSLRERPTSPDAFDLILRARSLQQQRPSPQRDQEALALYERAVLLDPSSVYALNWVAYYLIETRPNDWGNSENMQRAERLLARAREIAPNDARVLNTTVFWLRTVGRCQEVIELAEQALQMDPNRMRVMTGVYNELGRCKTWTGHAEVEIVLQEKANQLNPRSVFKYLRYRRMGFASLMLGRDEDAIAFFQRSFAMNPEARDDHTYSQLAAAYARKGQMEDARRWISEANRLWPYDTVRGHSPDGSPSTVYAEQIKSFQAALRLAGQRDHADEDADFSVPEDRVLHGNPVGHTPKSAPGANTIRTADLVRFLAAARPVVIDTATNSWGRSIPGAIGLKYAGIGGGFADAAQDRLGSKMRELTGGDLNRPVVAAGWNSEYFDGRNLALRLSALGYTNVYWYRGGRESWEVAGLPETELVMQRW